jgi:flagellar hook assembly protein FlgD
MPSTFRIDIYTITGRLVRRLDLKDLGLVYIGQNLNGFEWDGTDDYGDRLANGVYLYKATIRYPDGSEPKIREENGNANYFKNGFGKLVLFR